MKLQRGRRPSSSERQVRVDRLAHERTRFNGADDLRRRREGAPRWAPQPDQKGFNGADDLRRRRVLAGLLDTDGHARLQRGRRPSSSERNVFPLLAAFAAEASTGPTTFVVGEAEPPAASSADVDASTGPTTFVVGETHSSDSSSQREQRLQRGRRPSSSESLLQRVHHLGRAAASTGPTTFVVGENVAGVRRGRWRRASTGPTTFVVGESCRTPVGWTPGGCFNGADDLRRRRVDRATSSSAAETTGFNGADDLRRRRAMAGIDDRPIDASASTGPTTFVVGEPTHRESSEDGGCRASTGPTTFVVGEAPRSDAEGAGPVGGFNGADDLRRRRGLLDAASRVLTAALQRGRRPSSSERSALRGDLGGEHLQLQRGRRPSSSESARAADHSPEPAAASTGPTTFVVGEDPRRAVLRARDVLASTGPTTFVVGEAGDVIGVSYTSTGLQRGRRPSSSERRRTRAATSKTRPGFNGADDLRRRRAGGARGAPGSRRRFNGADDLRRRRARRSPGGDAWPPTLQRGRRPSSSERRTASSTR